MNAYSQVESAQDGPAGAGPVTPSISEQALEYERALRLHNDRVADLQRQVREKSLEVELAEQIRAKTEAESGPAAGAPNFAAGFRDSTVPAAPQQALSSTPSIAADLPEPEPEAPRLVGIIDGRAIMQVSGGSLQKIQPGGRVGPFTVKRITDRDVELSYRHQGSVRSMTLSTLN
ncbi:hypothetical protein JN531_016825 (plasmid) [Flagellatimonas centrodinii]|uniref:hypothetical protein n=1 Tax=Flagellatimonas centrodinii TaxID=2806210 RepID=UPI001FEE84E4|nr:hypothetical protein [Flagellatimonas centrodinii]ULQ48442.1 hypothetical protein JN531_016825 [Flagellatimonas centrodinii]